MTPAESARADAGEFHNVYINREAYERFRADGTFPEPTILVMERFAAADKEPRGVLTAGVYNGERLGLEVAVKNSSRPGGGKPWAYYDFSGGPGPSGLKASAPAKPDDQCETCHKDNAGRDNVWVQFYPALRKFIK
jgi:hypothetical protein